jgi:hypothetical protein
VDAFKLQDQLVEDYRHYAESFLTIKAERIREHGERDLDRRSAPQLNPAAGRPTTCGGERCSDGPSMRKRGHGGINT